jgi:hypothetical protein
MHFPCARQVLQQFPRSIRTHSSKLSWKDSARHQQIMAGKSDIAAVEGDPDKTHKVSSPLMTTFCT